MKIHPRLLCNMLNNIQKKRKPLTYWINFVTLEKVSTGEGMSQRKEAGGARGYIDKEIGLVKTCVRRGAPF